MSKFIWPIIIGLVKGKVSDISTKNSEDVPVEIYNLDDKDELAEYGYARGDEYTNVWSDRKIKNVWYRKRNDRTKLY